jgi:hypothetical protein
MPNEDKEVKQQEEFMYEPSYDMHGGTKFSFNGVLMVPAPGETERNEAERPKEMMAVVGSKPVLHVVENSVINPGVHRGQKVKMKMTDALRLRAKG